MPPPPYSSGTATPASPSSPAWSKKRRGNSPVLSISLARGRTTSSAKRRTFSRSSNCSSVSWISIRVLWMSDGKRGPGGGPRRIVTTTPRGVKRNAELPPSRPAAVLAGGRCFGAQGRRHDSERTPGVHRGRDPQLPAERLAPGRRRPAQRRAHTPHLRPLGRRQEAVADADRR